MPLADARVLAPAVTAHPEDPVGDLALLGKLADWAERYSPRVGLDGLDGTGGGGLWIDVTGAAHLFGGERALLRDLSARLARRGLTGRIAIACTGPAAWAAARFHPDAAEAPVVVAPGRVAQDLSGLPIVALGLDAGRTQGLSRLGLATIGAVLAVPRSVVANRYGQGTADRLAAFLGERVTALAPRRPMAGFESRISLAEPIVTEPAVAQVLDRLLADLCGRLHGAGRGARRLELMAFRVDGGVIRLAVGTARPSRDPVHLARLFRDRLTAIDAGFGLEVIALSATVTEPLQLHQMAFAPDSADGGSLAEGGTDRAASVGAAPTLDALIDRLGNRLGFAALRRLNTDGVHDPARASSWTSLASDADRRDAAPASARIGFAVSTPRPVRLRRHPVPVSVEADPQGRPLRLGRNGGGVGLASAEGPERIASDWTRGEDPKAWREYWRVTSREGARLWVFREASVEGKGVPEGDLNVIAPPEAGRNRGGRWFVHGVFA